MAAALTGTQKAALIIIQIGPAAAAKVMAHMTETEIESVSAEITRLNAIDPDTISTVMDEFRGAAQQTGGLQAFAGGGYAYAKKLLEDTLGKERAAEVMERMSKRGHLQPFEFLNDADARQVVGLLTGEHPQAIALVLSHLRPEKSAGIMSGLPEDTQAIVARRIALMSGTSPDVVTLVANTLRLKAANLLTSHELTTVGGIQPLVDIINRADAATEKQILEGLQQDDPELANQIRQLMFVFSDITLLEDRAIQLVLRGVETNTLATALKGAPEEVSNKVLKNMSSRAQELLTEEIEALGPTRISMVEEARSEIVQVIRSLEEKGEILISRDGEDEFVD